MDPAKAYNKSFHLLDQSFAETKDWDQTERLNFGLSPEFRSTNHRGAHHCSLHNVIADVIADIFYFLYIFGLAKKWSDFRSNWWTYLVHAKWTGELI